MNKYLWAVVALGLSTGAAFAATTPQADAISGNNQPALSQTTMQTGKPVRTFAENGAPSSRIIMVSHHSNHGAGSMFSSYPPYNFGGD